MIKEEIFEYFLVEEDGKIKKHKDHKCRSRFPLSNPRKLHGTSVHNCHTLSKFHLEDEYIHVRFSAKETVKILRLLSFLCR